MIVLEGHIEAFICDGLTLCFLQILLVIECRSSVYLPLRTVHVPFWLRILSSLGNVSNVSRIAFLVPSSLVSERDVVFQIPSQSQQGYILLPKEKQHKSFLGSQIYLAVLQEDVRIQGGEWRHNSKCCVKTLLEIPYSWEGGRFLWPYLWQMCWVILRNRGVWGTDPMPQGCLPRAPNKM